MLEYTNMFQFESGHHSLDKQLTNQPDSCIIAGGFLTLDELPHHTGVFDTPQELLARVDRFESDIRIAGASDFADEVAAAKVDQVGHEHAHARAARMVGFATVKYMFHIWDDGNGRLGDWQLGHAPLYPMRRVTKLAYASIVVAPSRPSDGDYERIEVLGYKDATDLAERIADHNKANLVNPLAMPLSIAHEITEP